MRKALLLATALAGISSVAYAADTPANRAPSPEAIAAAAGAESNPFGNVESRSPILRAFRAAPGVKVTAMPPAVDGLMGYLLESPTSSTSQTVYITPNGNSVCTGVQTSMSTDGKLQDVTAMQFAAMKNRFAEAQHKLELDQAAAEQARDKANAAAAALEDQKRQFAAATTQLGSKSADVGTILAQGTAQPAPAPASTPVTAPLPTAPGPLSAGVGALPPSSALPQASLAPVAEDGLPDNAQFVSALNKDAFLKVFASSEYLRIGRESNPTLIMVADPQCPHCHAVWSYLKPLLKRGALTVDLVLINGTPRSHDDALSILSSPNPSHTWMGDPPDYVNGQGSTEGVSIPPPPAAPAAGAVEPDGSPAVNYRLRGEGWLASNMAFIGKQGITSTPWLAYQGKDGKIYTYSGDNKTQLDAFLSDLSKVATITLPNK